MTAPATPGPRPWTLTVGYDDSLTRVIDIEGYTVCDTDRTEPDGARVPEAVENAAYIVRCVNERRRAGLLVRFLRELLEMKHARMYVSEASYHLAMRDAAQFLGELKKEDSL